MPTSATGIAVAFDCEQQERARTPIRRPWFDIVAKVHSPTLRAINTGKTREVLIQERGAQTPRFNQQCPAHKVPKLGAIFSVESRNFVVMEEKQVLLKRDNDAIRGVLLIVEDFDALSW